MYHGHKLALLLNSYRRTIQREYKTLCKLAEANKGKPATKELSEQIKKIERPFREAMARSIVEGLALAGRFEELNLHGLAKAIVAQAELSALNQKVAKTLAELEPPVEPQPSAPA